MMPGPSKSAKPDVVEVYFVGSTMGPVMRDAMSRQGPIIARHLPSIDDLLAHVEDHDVDCAVVDQSRPTESRGLKLALLASSRRVRHLVVLAPPGLRGEIEAIHGVHHAMRTPVAPKQVIDAVFAHAHAVTGTEPPAVKPKPVVATPVAEEQPVPPRMPAPRAPGLAARITGMFRRARNGVSAAAMGPSPWQRFLPLASMAYKKLAIVILASLFGLFLTYGTVIVFFLTSSGWSMPIELSSGHELVMRADKDLSEMRVRQNQIDQQLGEVEAALAIAERDKRDAGLRLQITKRSIDLELSQQDALLRETREHILRLREIISDFRNASGRGYFSRNLEEAYAKRTITKKSLEAGTLSVLESLHRMATINNELAVKEIEEDRINVRVEFLKSLREQIDLPEIRVLAAASSELVYLARDAISDQNIIAQAEKIIANRSVEADHLRDSRDVVARNIASVLATPVGRALSAPVTVVFVPYENASNYRENTPLYRCAMLVAFCRQVGVTGAFIPGETNAVHPLFGKPLRGTFVEAVLKDKNDAKEELLHAGRPPLFF